jgi:hypothetical protein
LNNQNQNNLNLKISNYNNSPSKLILPTVVGGSSAVSSGGSTVGSMSGISASNALNSKQ